MKKLKYALIVIIVLAAASTFSIGLTFVIVHWMGLTPKNDDAYNAKTIIENTVNLATRGEDEVVVLMTADQKALINSDLVKAFKESAHDAKYITHAPDEVTSSTTVITSPHDITGHFVFNGRELFYHQDTAGKAYIFYDERSFLIKDKDTIEFITNNMLNNNIELNFDSCYMITTRKEALNTVVSFYDRGDVRKQSLTYDADNQLVMFEDTETGIYHITNNDSSVDEFITDICSYIDFNTTNSISLTGIREYFGY